MRTHRYVGFIINDCSALRCQSCHVCPATLNVFKRQSECNKIRELCSLFWQVLAGYNCSFIGILWWSVYSKVIYLQKTRVRCLLFPFDAALPLQWGILCSWLYSLSVMEMELIYSNTILNCNIFRGLVLSLSISIFCCFIIQLHFILEANIVLFTHYTHTFTLVTRILQIIFCIRAKIPHF